MSLNRNIRMIVDVVVHLPYNINIIICFWLFNDENDCHVVKALFGVLYLNLHNKKENFMAIKVILFS